MPKYYRFNQKRPVIKIWWLSINLLCYVEDDDTWLIINKFRKACNFFSDWKKVLHELSCSKVYLVGKLLSDIIWSQLISILGMEEVFNSDQSESQILLLLFLRLIISPLKPRQMVSNEKLPEAWTVRRFNFRFNNDLPQTFV